MEKCNNTNKPFYVMSLLSLIFLLLFVKLSLWQFNRAEEKAIILNKISVSHTNNDSDKINLNQIKTLSEINELPEYSYVMLKGSFDKKKSILLSNQHHQHVLGYHILTPFKLNNSPHTLLINRGFIPEITLSSLNFIDKHYNKNLDNISITGIIKKSNSKQYIMGENLVKDPRHPTKTIIQKIDLQEPLIINALGHNTSTNYINLLSPSSAGYTLDWQWTNITPEKHKAYAITWLLLAITVILLYSYFCYITKKI